MGRPKKGPKPVGKLWCRNHHFMISGDFPMISLIRIFRWSAQKSIVGNRPRSRWGHWQRCSAFPNHFKRNSGFIECTSDSGSRWHGRWFLLKNPLSNVLKNRVLKTSLPWTKYTSLLQDSCANNFPSRLRSTASPTHLFGINIQRRFLHRWTRSWY